MHASPLATCLSVSPATAVTTPTYVIRSKVNTIFLSTMVFSLPRLPTCVQWWMVALAVMLYTPPSSVGTSLLTPSPSSSPSFPFLEYVKNNTLYIYIESMTILIHTHEEGCYDITPDEYSNLKSLPSADGVSKPDSDTLHFWKYYKYNQTHQSSRTFFFNFTFELESTSTDQTWFISSFTHSNRTANSTEENDTCTFEYSGLSRAVHAPSDMSYYCSNVVFYGDCVDGIKSQVSFTGLRIQAFGLKKRKPSSMYIDCGAKDPNNSIIDVVVGSVVGSTLVIALVIIIVTLAIKKVRRRGYDLLDD